VKVKELMQRVGLTQTGRAIAYIKDGLDEMNMTSETHVTTQRIDVVKDQRFYDLPNDTLKIIDIRCKNHDNNKDEYRSIPRTIHPPATEDSDGV
jgi:hypothetical protein|tara:strand:+ start:1910 stop:2191 length:282 start_codon:yes stop_codon:yes gene_type:complete